MALKFYVCTPECICIKNNIQAVFVPCQLTLLHEITCIQFQSLVCLLTILIIILLQFITILVLFASNFLFKESRRKLNFAKQVDLLFFIPICMLAVHFRFRIVSFCSYLFIYSVLASYLCLLNDLTTDFLFVHDTIYLYKLFSMSLGATMGAHLKERKITIIYN